MSVWRAIRSGLRVLTAAGALTLVGAVRGEDDRASRDLLLTVRARERLCADPVLGPLNLGATVQRGVLTLWGSLPSAELAWEAQELLQRLPGLDGIRSEVTIDPPSVEEPLPPGRSAKPATLAGFDGDRPPTSVLPGREPPAATASRTVPPSVSPSAAVLLPPTGADPAAEALRQATLRARGNDRRFRWVDAEAAGGVVYLRGRVGTRAELMELAAVVSRVPGVARVVVEGVTIEAPALEDFRIR